MSTNSIEWIEKHGTTAQGKKEYLAFLRGDNLTMKQRVLANCFQCTGMYTDGREDCQMEECTFHVYMPYRKGGVVKVRTVSEETKAKMREARLRKGSKIKTVAVA
jgi:hypothetical protein